MAEYDLRYEFLSDDDAKRLYARHPALKPSSDDYCPTCQKTGTYQWHGEVHECDCAMQLQLHKHYLHAGIGYNPYQILDWDDYVYHPDAKAAALQYLERADRLIPRGRGMILSGPNGTGKTMLAMLVLKELVRRGYDCMASTFSNTIESLTAGWYDKGEKEWFARRFMYSQVLLLDDVGKERSYSALPETTFDNLLRTRVQAGRVTLLSTNLDFDGLGTGYGKSALSLLTEVNSFFDLEEVDIRRSIMDRNQQEDLAGETRPIF